MIDEVVTADISKAALRERAVTFAHRWKDARSEQAYSQTFWNEFFGIFGVDIVQVGAFEQVARRATTGRDGRIDLLVSRQMAVEQKSAGKDLDAAMDQLVDYLPSLHRADDPWLLVVCDFRRFRWQNLRDRTSGEFRLEELSSNLDLFWWLAGHAAPHERFETEEDVNLAATELLRELHDQLQKTNYPAADLQEWLTRILFCLFADDTEVWPRAAFQAYLAHNTRLDGSDLGPTLAYLFQILDTPPAERPETLDEDLAQFEYINGDLFDRQLSIPTCTEAARTALLEACTFNWSAISPAIFGSMFQDVMTPIERRQIGAHYTTEANILRTIRPLFLDDLEDELASLDSVPKLNAFHDRLSRLTFFDPACGCGNFLVIAYREIRRLETETLRRIVRKDRKRTEGQRAMSLELFCKVTVDQFHGIEIEEFPARIARTALYLIDHIANREVSIEFGDPYVRFPIRESPHIHQANALAMDWNEVLPADRASYVFGNPPFVGMSHMDVEQRKDNLRVFTGTSGTGRLDYVACWYARTWEYVGRRPVRCAFVSTSSVTQGEQARVMSLLLLRAGQEIDFAHRTFAWTSEASGTANVHVVIIGFSVGGQSKHKRLFDYPDVKGEPKEEVVPNINWYLAPAADVFIGKHSRPISPVPKLTEGNRPEDKGGLILTADEAEGVRRDDPVAARYLRELVAAKEWLNGIPRFCFWLVDADPDDLHRSPILRERLGRVRDARLAARDNTGSENRRRTLERLAATPGLFTAIRQPRHRYLCAPRHSSEGRRIVPMWFCEPDQIAHDSTVTVDDAPLWLFGVMQSAMFMAWLRSVGGRLESRLRITPDIAYNAFPFPDAGPSDHRTAVESAAQAVLVARDQHPDSSLAALYDPLAMPPALSEAHDRLDRAVDRFLAPRRRPYTEGDRLAILFERYELLTAPMTAATTPKRRRR